MSPDLHLAPDAVVALARHAHRIADDLQGGTPTGTARRAVDELLAFAAAAEDAARRARDADAAASDRFREPSS